MQYTINEIRQEVFSKVFQVYDIIKDFFGEEHVDLQGIPTDSELLEVMAVYEVTDIGEGRYEVSADALNRIKRYYGSLVPFILIWWPRVTVTNENGRSVNIQDLYAKVKVTMEGRIPYEYRGFMLCRTTYSKVQYLCGYMHSHVPSFYSMPDFALPCLGTGPINNTIMDLKNGFDELIWMLFCQELSLYVTVESLKGGPHFRMEQIGSRRELYGYSEYKDGYTLTAIYSNHRIMETERIDYFNNILSDFILYYLQYGHLSVNYKNGMFEAGMTYFDYMIDVSNAFIDFFNQFGNSESLGRLHHDKFIVKALAADNRFYDPDDRGYHRNSLQDEGNDMFIFKGEMKHLHIEQEEESETTVTTLLANDIAMYILSNVLKIINYRYRNEHNNKSGSERASATTYKAVCYL